MFTSKMFWRDLVMHRQLVTHKNGLMAVEYSPTYFRQKSINHPAGNKMRWCSERSSNYFNGGTWSEGLPGVNLPPCEVSGRDVTFGGSYISNVALDDGSTAVRFRGLQISEVHFPRWFPMPQKWYAVAASLIVRNCERGFSQAMKSTGARQLYKDRKECRPPWYRSEWLGSWC